MRNIFVYKTSSNNIPDTEQQYSRYRIGIMLTKTVFIKFMNKNIGIDRHMSLIFSLSRI